MSKKQAHGPIPSGNQPKHGINRRKPTPEEEEEQLAETTAEDATPIILDDVADEKGHIKPAVNRDAGQ